MPSMPGKHCAYQGCPNIVVFGYCEEHAHIKRRQYRESRNKDHQYLYGNRWRKARKVWLSQHPLCDVCAGMGRTVSATVVHHRTPHDGDRLSFWDRANWQSLCNDHHEAIHRDGRFKRGGGG